MEIDFKPIVGITIGDIAGIGPEIVAKVLGNEDIYKVCRPLIIGTLDAMKMGMDFAGLQLELCPVDSTSSARYEQGKLNILDLKNIEAKEVELGKASARTGKAGIEYTICAVELAIKKEIHAVACAPMNKLAMHMAGYNFSGQTELIAQYLKVDDYGMVLSVDEILIFQHTTHISLREAINAVKKERLVKTIKLADSSLKFFGYPKPRLGIAGLNPHAGESGLFGSEEKEEMVPAICDARSMGINISDPVPADALFVQARSGQYDGVIALYHDQANIGAKLLGDDPVTVVAGFPIIRTSVVHGTAYDIVGRGIANPSMMKKAVKLAADLAKKRFGRP